MDPWKAFELIVMSTAAFPGLPFLTAWVDINPAFQEVVIPLFCKQTEGKLTN